MGECPRIWPGVDKGALAIVLGDGRDMQQDGAMGDHHMSIRGFEELFG